MASELDLSSSIAETPTPSPRDIVVAVIDGQFDKIQTSIRVLVARSGLAEGASEIAELADEILQTTAEEALRGAETYDPSRAAHPWLLGIAAHKIADLQKVHIKQHKLTVPIEGGVSGPVSDSRQAHDPENRTPEDRLDAALYHSSRRDQLIDSDRALEEMLSMLDADDRKLLTLVYVEGLDGSGLATALGIREGAAYVRLARARERLRQKYLAAEGRTGKDR